ncbi:LysR family transcriptional regulator [Pseudaminobacter sp. 19-2017]|uniref:LysR family transcriptional regulator n=1 Tax=Pseudaminobacter soli (ex Zhang et al. 2022) TaxID=2831468 RepID=A0A942E217_9HYPH|nr:LysR family transcriptional regulator [Pseudaminobacter soli]MBS3651673.1 LysR family transcriptional regulator [Pseudaminobacter soli]
MADIDMKLLRSFLSVATERNFSRAADRLGCSQATVSLRIKNLEGTLGRKLFDRGYHLVELSQAGRDLLPQVQIIVDHHDMLFDGMKRGKITGTVKLGVAEDYVQPILSRLMRVVETSLPGVELSITSMLSAKLANMVEARNLDLAIVTLPTQKSHSTVLSCPRLVWVAAEDFVIDRTKPWPLAFYPEGCVFRAAAMGALGREGVKFREFLNSASGEVIKCAVSSGTAVTVMAEGTIPHGFIALPKDSGLPELPNTCIQLLERADGLSKAAQRLKVSIMKLLGA